MGNTPVLNTLKTAALLAALAALFVVIGDALGGTSGMLIAFVLALVLNVGTYWFSGDVALRMAGAHPIAPEEAPELHQLVSELATAAGLPTPRLAIIDDPSPNAFATGRDPSHAVVAVTSGILGLLDRRELSGVLAHELSHVQNRDILIASVAATLAGAITMLASMARWALLLGGVGSSRGRRGSSGDLLAGLFMIILAPIAATLIQLAISRSREFQADSAGAHLEGDPEPLARALEKLDMATRLQPLQVAPAVAHLFILNPLHASAVATLFSTHPPTAERIPPPANAGAARLLRDPFNRLDVSRHEFGACDPHLTAPDSERPPTLPVNSGSAC
jgi:heat shock protein HtpX